LSAAPDVLARLRDAGAEVVIRGGRPILRAPAPLPTELLAEAKAHRDELLALVTGKAEASSGTPAPSMLDAAGNPQVPCPACGCGQWWRLSAFPERRLAGAWHCRRCAPPPINMFIDGATIPAEVTARAEREGAAA